MTLHAPGSVQTVDGPVAAVDLGVTLPHEHLFNDLSGCLTEPAYRFSQHLHSMDVSPSAQWALRQDPYCCLDNVAPKDFAGVCGEAEAFRRAGGGTIVDATGSSAIGRDAAALRRLARATGIHVVMSTGPYLERFEREVATPASIEAITRRILSELRDGIGPERVRAGLIGEVGISPAFTEAEHTALRGASLAQMESPGVAMNIHMPGWQRRGDEVLDIAVDEMGADPARISLAHSDPSGADTEYQLRLLDRGVWLEFDMIGLDITFPGEGVSPTLTETADAVAHLVELGYADQLLLSHDLFLKQMWTSMGGNGLTLVPTVFLELLEAHGVPPNTASALVTTNPQRYLSGGTQS